jgi:hypothetical protein
LADGLIVYSSDEFPPCAGVSVLAIDIDAISADALRVATIILLALLCLSNEISAFVVSVPADAMR